MYKIGDLVEFVIEGIDSVCVGQIDHIYDEYNPDLVKYGVDGYILDPDNERSNNFIIGLIDETPLNYDKELGDIINTPPHYTQGDGIEPIDFITSNNMTFLEGNVVKYITRYKYKNGLEDLKKAQFYLNKLIKENE